MKTDNDDFRYHNYPRFLNEAQTLSDYIRKLHYDDIKSIWKCNDSIATLNFERFKNMDLKRNLSPAIFSYQGIQYDYMNPNVFEEEEFRYIENHLRILSGLYGILRPFDGVVPYRLEMQAKLNIDGNTSLYSFWRNKIAESLFAETDCIINLASKEYSKCISKYLNDDVKFITCIFGEENHGKILEKGTYAKMARGEMVRFMAEKRIENICDIKKYNRQNYSFSEEFSDDKTFVFVKRNKKAYALK